VLFNPFLKPIIIDANSAQWEQDLEAALFNNDDTEVDLLNCNQKHFEVGQRLAAFLRLDFNVDQTTRTASFRRRHD
jgi:hypothetical protein